MADSEKKIEISHINLKSNLSPESKETALSDHYDVDKIMQGKRDMEKTVCEIIWDRI